MKQLTQQELDTKIHSFLDRKFIEHDATSRFKRTINNKLDTTKNLRDMYVNIYPTSDRRFTTI